MTLPNKLTFLRFFLTPFAIIFLFLDIPYNYFIAIFIFIIGASTDYLDGYIARKYNQVTKLGVFLDPMVDKIFIYSLLMTMLSLNIFPLWIVPLLFTRDLFVDAFKNLAVSFKDFVPSFYPGKVKTFFVIAAVIFGELSLAVQDGYNIFSLSPEIIKNAAYICLIIALIIGFVGSIPMLEKCWKNMTGKYEI